MVCSFRNIRFGVFDLHLCIQHIRLLQQSLRVAVVGEGINSPNRLLCFLHYALGFVRQLQL